MRAGLAVLGMGLSFLWIAGLNDPELPSWFVWADFAVAIASLMAAAVPVLTRAGMVPVSRTVGGRDFGAVSAAIMRALPFGCALALFALWIIGISTGAVSWFAWWTFAFASAYLVVGLGITSPVDLGRTAPPRTA